MYQHVATDDGRQEVTSSLHMVSAGYFETLRIPFRAGRGFDAVAEAPGVTEHVIVNRRLADLLWRGTNPVGRRLRLIPARGPASSAEVIGLVDPVAGSDLRQQGVPQIYESGGRGYNPAFVVRTAGDPATFATAIKGAIEALQPGRPVFGVRPLESMVDEASADSRFALYRRDAGASRGARRPDACAAIGVATTMTCCPPRGEVAQLVEHTTENRSVDSSILSLATTFPVNSARSLEPEQRKPDSGLQRGCNLWNWRLPAPRWAIASRRWNGVDPNAVGEKERLLAERTAAASLWICPSHVRFK